MMPRGFRDFIYTNMAGRPVEGSVRRARDLESGEQIVILRIVASLATLVEIECSLLNSDLWDWITSHREDRYHYSHRKFTILPSWVGAVKGSNSDPKGDYDYKSSIGSGSHKTN